VSTRLRHAARHAEAQATRRSGYQDDPVLEGEQLEHQFLSGERPLARSLRDCRIKTTDQRNQHVANRAALRVG
jgi:hypothetical protein